MIGVIVMVSSGVRVCSVNIVEKMWFGGWFISRIG